MNLLFVLSNWTFPGKEGLHIQTAAWLAELVRMGVRVRLLVFARDIAAVDTRAIESSWGGGVSVVVHHLGDTYPVLLMKNMVLPARFNPVLRHISQELRTGSYDAVHLEGIGLAPLLPTLSGVAPVVMSTVDAWSLRQARLAQQGRGLKKWALRAYSFVTKWAERRYFPHANAVHVVSSDDAAYLVQTQRLGNVVTIPVGLLHIPPSAEPQLSTAPLVFWGDIGVGYLRSGLVWLMTEVVPLLASRHQVVVIGRRAPDEQLVKLCGPGARFLTWVDDVESVLRQASVVVLPDQSGSGMKNRTLSAMACGVPVVGSHFAFEGFDVLDGDHCFVRDTPEDFASTVDTLMRDDGLRRAVGARGRAFVVGRYSIQGVACAWLCLYKSTIDHMAVRSAPVGV
jgi:glycosyltransferase involved in cell wall biosynthesis